MTSSVAAASVPVPVSSSAVTVPKKKASVTKITDFSLKEDVVLKVVKGKSVFVKFQTAEGGPVLIELNHGGNIPPSFGFKVTSNNNMISSFGLTPEEFAETERIDNELVAIVTANAAEWGVQQGQLTSFSEDKPSPKGKSYGPICLFNNVEQSHIGTPNLRIMDDNKNNITDLPSLNGSHWSKVWLELRGIFFSKNGTYGISRKLRRMDASGGPKYVLPFPGAFTTETTPVATIVDLPDFDLNTHVNVGALSNGKVKAAHFDSTSGGPVVLRIANGRFPKFAVEFTKFNQVTVTWSVDSEEDYEKFCVIREQLQEMTVNRRDEWMPTCKDSDEILKSNVKELVSERKEKVDEPGKLWPALVKGVVSPEVLVDPAATETFFVKKSDKFKAVLDGVQIFDLAQLRNTVVNEVWLELTCVFIAGKKSVGVSKKVVYVDAATRGGSGYELPSDDEEDADVNKRQLEDFDEDGSNKKQKL